MSLSAYAQSLQSRRTPGTALSPTYKTDALVLGAQSLQSLPSLKSDSSSWASRLLLEKWTPLWGSSSAQPSDPHTHTHTPFTKELAVGLHLDSLDSDQRGSRTLP